MKEQITYSCGHTGTIEVFGSAKERERKIRNTEQYEICPECEAIERQEKIAAQKEIDTAAGLPELTGSEKQIAWALELRVKFMRECKERNMPENIRPIYDYILTNVKDSREWIDNRFSALDLLCKYKDAALNK